MPHLPGSNAFFTVQEAAEAVKCSARTIYRYISDGTLEARQGPTAMLVPRESLQKFVDRFPPVGGAT